MAGEHIPTTIDAKTKYAQALFPLLDRYIEGLPLLMVRYILTPGTVRSPGAAGPRAVPEVGRTPGRLGLCGARG